MGTGNSGFIFGLQWDGFLMTPALAFMVDWKGEKYLEIQ